MRNPIVVAGTTIDTTNWIDMFRGLVMYKYTEEDIDSVYDDILHKMEKEGKRLAEMDNKIMNTSATKAISWRVLIPVKGEVIIGILLTVPFMVLSAVKPSCDSMACIVFVLIGIFLVILAHVIPRIDYEYIFVKPKPPTPAEFKETHKVRSLVTRKYLVWKKDGKNLRVFPEADEKRKILLDGKLVSEKELAVQYQSYLRTMKNNGKYKGDIFEVTPFNYQQVYEGAKRAFEAKVGDAVSQMKKDREANIVKFQTQQSQYAWFLKEWYSSCNKFNYTLRIAMIGCVTLNMLTMIAGMIYLSVCDSANVPYCSMVQLPNLTFTLIVEITIIYRSTKLLKIEEGEEDVFRDSVCVDGDYVKKMEEKRRRELEEMETNQCFGGCMPGSNASPPVIG